MNCLRNKTVCEIHLIFYLILTVILCTSIVSYIYYQNNLLKGKCVKDCPKSDTSKDNFNSTETYSTVVLIDRNQKYVDLNFQSLISDGKINSLVVKSRNTIELMRNTLNIPCILVGISINGSDLWTQGMGYSDLENGVKCHKHSAFSLGSMSKPMISLLIAWLMDSKNISLDENIEDIDFNSYPIYNPHKRENVSIELRLRQLMSEIDVIKIENFNQTYNYCDRYLDVYEAPVSPDKLKFYESIVAWNIITDKIECLLNESFPLVLNDFLFRKLNLISTGVMSEESIVPYRLQYYHKNDYNLQNYAIDNEIPVECWPSYGVMATIPELMMFGRKVIDIYQHKLDPTISGSTFKQFISRQIQHPINQDIYYGLGWMLFDGNANETVSNFFGYSGQTSGSSYLFMVRPDSDFVIALFANLGGAEQDLHKLAMQLMNNFQII